MFWWPYLCQVCSEECDEKVCNDCKQIQKYIAIKGSGEIVKELDILYKKVGEKPRIRIHTRSITKSN